MILLINTSTAVCTLVFVDNDIKREFSWQSDRNLAKGLLKFIYENLISCGYDWKDISGIGVFEGPGSFTGLRIGLTVMNTLADSINILIVGVGGDDWQNKAIERLKSNENDKIVMPAYGAEAKITSPKK